MQNQNQANAMTLQAQFPTIETNANTYNNQNSLQAANLAGIIPQMAWSRLTGANSGLQQTNPLSALQLLNGFQTQGYNQRRGLLAAPDADPAVSPPDVWRPLNGRTLRREPGGSARRQLTPAGSPPPDVGILPDTSPIVGPPPRSSTAAAPAAAAESDAGSEAATAGVDRARHGGRAWVHGGGAGALAGLRGHAAALRQDQLASYQRAVNEQKIQEAAIKTQFGQDESDYRQREAKLQSALANFKTQALKLPDKAAYDGLADAYGNSLRAAGYRTISPDWLRQNIPYVKPSQTSLADKAFKAWQSNPNNKRLLDENPAQAATSVVEVDLNGDGVKERMPLAKLAEAAGQSFAHDQDGKLIAVPKEANTGTSPFDVTLKGIVDEFKATNRRDPNPREKNTLIAKAWRWRKRSRRHRRRTASSCSRRSIRRRASRPGVLQLQHEDEQWSQPSGTGPEATKGRSRAISESALGR
jgi:hypothetical protein